MGKMNHILLGWCLVCCAHAQSATNFDTKVVTSIAPSTKITKSTIAAAEKDISANPALASRYVGDAELEAYLSSLSSILMAGTRDQDPFGHYQDPDAKPIVKPTVTTVARVTNTRVTPLSEIVQLLSITTIMPGEKSFLLGTRKIKKGDELPLLFRGKALKVKVTEVTSRMISFANIDSGEIGTRTLDMLPTGMRAGNGTEEIKAPGMIPDRPNAPIELEMGNDAP